MQYMAHADYRTLVLKQTVGVLRYLDMAFLLWCGKRNPIEANLITTNPQLINFLLKNNTEEEEF